MSIALKTVHVSVREDAEIDVQSTQSSLSMRKARKTRVRRSKRASQ